MGIATVNPATGEVVRTFEEHSDEEVERRLELAAACARDARASSFAERAARMRRAAELVEAEKQPLGQLMTTEMGKTLRSAVAEAEKCAWACRHYAEAAERYLADEAVASNAARSFLRYLPLGPVLAVMPWNFPFWQVFRFAAPALMAGNVGLLKHASNVPECALAIERIFARAGFPDGAFQTLLISAKRTARVIADERVRAVTLTGSDAAGADVGEHAGRAIKKVVLELGGSDPFIVMPSADLDGAVKTAVSARIINNGQSCIAAKRFIVHERVYGEFERRFVEGLGRLKVGDPTRADTDVGPLATERGRAELARQVERAIHDGARLLVGGRAVDGPGFYYPPTALADLPAGAAIRREEVFGPVALLFRVRSLDEAIAIANDSPYGLGSSVWTADAAEQHRFVDEIEAGQTFINAMVASDPRLPFGGVKQSGFGRELGALGIREFTNIKTIYIA
ncbi:MAG TPA: NAD-dependent succinate-semialdehyde dehydrogenase [Polyangia bacterium]|nr:NAD-dependent succinate-semialdehyde dehydrogenase [Polyangia bacterium]